MKIALIQLNPVIGDFAKNCEAINRFAHQAHESGCQLALFPEMAVSGYPPQDLLERSSFIKDHAAALDELVEKLPPIDVILGGFEENSKGEGKSLFNAAFVVRNNKIIQTVHKQLLPSYDVFDEKRYFESGNSGNLYEIQGKWFGLTICEDIWHEEVGEYSVDPVDDLVATAGMNEVKLEGIINISASPFQKGKRKTRMSIFQSISRRYNTPVFYVNQVGGQDSLLFDGDSMAFDAKGTICASLPSFTEAMEVVQLDGLFPVGEAALEYTEVGRVYDALVMGVRDYVSKCGFSSVVLGLSGGIDSALTATIAVDALGAENVLGVALPSKYSSAGSVEDAQQLAENLGCKYEVIPIKELFDTFNTTLNPLFKDLDEDLTEQNLQARIRGNLLMALSNKFGHLLLTTGNKSEMAVGYCTLYGDMSGGLAVISDVPKQLVYELSQYANRDKVRIPVNTITKPPSAELKPDQYDQDDLPDYELLDQILEMHLELKMGQDEIISEGFEESIVKDTLRRIRLNEYKRKQAPMGLKVTSKAFGYGRRFPNVQNYTR